MDYFKGVLATIAALFLAVLVPQLRWLIRSLTTEKATGIAIFTSGFVEIIFSTWFWVLVMLFSVVFYFFGQFENKTLRVSLFWIPTIGATVGGFGFWALFAFIIRRFGRG